MQRSHSIPGIQKLQMMKKTLILYHGDELVIQSDSLNYLLCNIVLYQMSSINAALLSPPCETVAGVCVLPQIVL